MISILGPTATGKTQLAVAVARELGGEIISADSRQVYKELSIGAGKDLNDYLTGGRSVPYHLIDICTLAEEYNLFRFREDFDTAYQHITSRNNIPILCGGTGLYCSSVLEAYSLPPLTKDSAEYEQLLLQPVDDLKKELLSLSSKKNLLPDLQTKERLVKALMIARSKEVSHYTPPPAVNFAIMPTIEGRKENIRKRLSARYGQGMIEETRQLLQEGVTPERLDMLGLEYRYISAMLKGTLSFEEMDNLLFIAICDFAKRQMTWIRRMIRKGVGITVIETDDFPTRLSTVLNGYRSRS